MKKKILIVIMTFCLILPALLLGGCDLFNSSKGNVQPEEESSVSNAQICAVYASSKNSLDDCYSNNVVGEAKFSVPESNTKINAIASIDAMLAGGVTDIVESDVNNCAAIASILIDIPQTAFFVGTEYDKVYSQKNASISGDRTADLYFKYVSMGKNVVQFDMYYQTSANQKLSLRNQIYIDYEDYDYIIDGIMIVDNGTGSASVFFYRFDKKANENTLSRFELAQIQISNSSALNNDELTASDISIYGTVVESYNFQTQKAKVATTGESVVVVANAILNNKFNNSNLSNESVLVNVDYFSGMSNWIF